MKDQINIRFLVLLGITALIGVWRTVAATPELSEWTNFSPLGAMALFAGTYFASRYKAYLSPLLILFISDLILMQTLFAEFRSGLLYQGWQWTYGSFVLMVGVGDVLKKGSTLRSILLGGLLAGCAHFVLSNFGVWLNNGIDLSTGIAYTRDLSGLTACYVAAIPYFKNLLLGNWIYGTLLFGGFILMQRKFPILRPQMEK